MRERMFYIDGPRQMVAELDGTTHEAAADDADLAALRERMAVLLSGDVMEEGWWHPITCSNEHDEGGNCLDAGGHIVGWREQRVVPVVDE